MKHKALKKKKSKQPGTRKTSRQPNNEQQGRQSTWVDRLAFIPIRSSSSQHVWLQPNSDNSGDSTPLSPAAGTAPDGTGTARDTTTGASTPVDTRATHDARATTPADAVAAAATHHHHHPVSISVVSWNVLAHSYCSPYSQSHLPPEYQPVVFHAGQQRRLQLIQRILCDYFGNNAAPAAAVHHNKNDHPIDEHDDNHGDDNDNDNNAQTPRQGIRPPVADVLLLQEVDARVHQAIHEPLRQAGFRAVQTEFSHYGSGGSCRGTDACVVYVRTAEWTILEHERIRLDDLATLTTTCTTSLASSSSSKNSPAKDDTGYHAAADDADEEPNIDTTTNPTSCNNIQGLQQAFLRRNMALLVRLQHVPTGQTVVIANAHLYWHPSYEYVKLCQAHYILERARNFCRQHEPFLLGGDFNSKPLGVTHTYLTRGWICAKKQAAPWYQMALAASSCGDNDDNNNDDDDKSPDFVDEMGQLTLDSSNYEEKEVDVDDSNNNNVPEVRYLLDYTLNKLCRWLRILGQDAALETEQEEKLRTGEGNMILFEKCRQEGRTLITTSTRLVLRKDCPSSAYCINPVLLPHLEVALVHLLLTHGVVLEPAKFLSRCVVCNGTIVAVDSPEEAKAILMEYQAPLDFLEQNNGMAVYVCSTSTCRQGYWWSDRPTSSASRVKIAATRLFELCLRAGVPIHPNDSTISTNDLGLFSGVNIQELRQQGWDYSAKGSELLEQRLLVIDWLKSDRLECPFQLESAYAVNNTATNGVDGEVAIKVLRREVMPFTNVTHAFVDTLDYIFFDKKNAILTERLYVPTSFSELNEKGIGNGHLLPSNIWPSDHLAIGARFSLVSSGGEEDGTTQLQQREMRESVGPSVSSAGISGGDLQQQLFCGIIGVSTPPPPPTAELLPQSPSKAAILPQLSSAMPGSSSTPQVPPHGQRCACGCIPAVPSLFEMAELRRQARIQRNLADMTGQSGWKKH